MASNLDSQIAKDFGVYIATARERRGLLQSDVAGNVGISQPYYSNIEKGLKIVPFPLALKICKALNITIDEFVGSYM